MFRLRKVLSLPPSGTISGVVRIYVFSDVTIFSPVTGCLSTNHRSAASAHRTPFFFSRVPRVSLPVYYVSLRTPLSCSHDGFDLEAFSFVWGFGLATSQASDLDNGNNPPPEPAVDLSAISASAPGVTLP